MKYSAGLLLYRRHSGRVQVLLVHPGGPFWAKKDEGAWSIPKGEFDPSLEDALAAARREVQEETGYVVNGVFRELHALKQPSGKQIRAWAIEADWDESKLRSNTFMLEWPKGSGKMAEFPEVDRAGWFDLSSAMNKILPGQAGFVAELAAILNGRSK